MGSFLKSPPRIAELVFVSLLVWMFATGQGWTVMLADGDTGWHIRNGERIVQTWSVPHADPFSFGSAGHPWFAWEWLSDVVFAGLFHVGGLKAVAWFCGVIIAASISVLLRHMTWRSIGIHISFPLALVTAGASSIHYLARPHVFGLLLFVAVAWMLDRDRANSTPWIWTLPAVFLLWTNLHGSFLAGLAMVGFRVVEGRDVKRTASILAASIAATLINPYGWNLHVHALEFLRSDWIQASVEEFQSPHFRSASIFFYEGLLLCGIAALPWLLRRKEIYGTCAILFWAHQSLVSVRHVPLYSMAACPFMGVWLDHYWRRWARRQELGSLARTVDAIDLAWRPWCGGYTVWPWILAVALAVTGSPAVFPPNKFPVSLVERNIRHLSSAAPQRVFSSDQWSDYLIFRLYPAVRVYFDGRSDFYGLWRGQPYLALMRGAADSPGLLERSEIRWALVPKDWALAGLLRGCSTWRAVDADDQAILFEREPEKTASASNQTKAESR